MRNIVFANNKGGVGKTTACVTTAAGLAARGHRVLIIDGDAQGHVSTMLGMNRRPALYDLLVREAAWEHAIEDAPVSSWMVRGEHATPQARLAVLASNKETRSITDYVDDDYALLRRLAQVSKDFDYVLIDTSPTPSPLHSLLWAASTDLIFCSLAERLSLQGLIDTLVSVQKFNDERKGRNMRPIHLAGIQFTRVRANVGEHEANIRDTEKRWPTLVLPSIKERIAWAESNSAKKTIFAYDPDCDAALEGWSLVDVLEVGRGVVKAG